MCSGHAFDYSVSITTYIYYFRVSTDKVHYSSITEQLFYIYEQEKRERICQGNFIHK